MIKRKIALALVICGLSTSVVQASASVVNNGKGLGAKQVKTTKVTSSNEKKFDNMASIKGSIINITKEKNKASIIIEGSAVYENVYSEVQLMINSGTRITDEKGNKLSLEDIKEGMEVKAIHTPTVTKSITPQGVAKEIIVISKKEQEKLLTAEGKVVDINKNKSGIMVTMQHKDTENPLEGQVNLLIDEKTVIVNESNGKKLTMEDIKDGMKIRGYYGPVVTMSIPLTTYAKKVVVMDEKKIDYSEAEGNIVDINKNKNGIMISVQEKYTQNPLEGQIRLTINEETEIVSEAGKKLTMDDIKDGMKVRAEYGPAVTMSIPPMSHANKIVVLEDNEKKLYEIKGNIVDTMKYDDGVMARIKSNNQEYFVFISDYSQIISGKDNKELDIKDIEKDMEVKVYFDTRNGMSHLRSYIPTMCLAEKVVVQNYDKLYVADVAEYVGVVEKVNKNDDKISVLVKQEKGSKYGYNELIFHINDNTRINTRDFNDLKEGEKVQIFYSGAVTRSLPGQTNAIAINILK